MKLLIALAVFFHLFVALLSAQTSVIVRANNGNPQVYPTADLKKAFDDAAKIEGDTVWLPEVGTMYLDAAFIFDKRIHLIGVGHHPAKQSKLKGGGTYFHSITLKGDGSSISGIHFAGTYTLEISASKCLITRSRIDKIFSGSGKSFMDTRILECVVGSIDLPFHSSVIIKNNILYSGDYQNENIYIDRNSLLESNIFADTSKGGVLVSCKNSIIRNNIFLAKERNSRDLLIASSNNSIQNNLFYESQTKAFSETANSHSNNRFDIPRESFFKKFDGSDYDYQHDFHLKDGNTFIKGTDGTEVGIYGGTGWKEDMTPIVPKVVSNTTPANTEGNTLKVNIKVEAQTR